VELTRTQDRRPPRVLPSGGPGGPCVRSRTDSGLTALILGCFAMGWFGWGQSAGQHLQNAVLTVGSTAALVVAILGATLAFRRPRCAGATHNRATNRRYGIVVGLEFALAGVGAGVLAATGAAPYIPVWVCAVVGLHMFPLATVLDDAALRWLGVAITIVAICALLVGVLTDVAPARVTGAGAGLALLTFATAVLAPYRARGAHP
jgi:hypothetical protein